MRIFLAPPATPMLRLKFCLVVQVAASLLVAGVATTIQAQTYAPTALTGPVASGAGRKNVVRLDLLSPLYYNVSNSLFGTGVVYPVLVSYERHLSKQWSVGAEALFNGGEPKARRNGAGLMARYYLTEAATIDRPMAGLYLSPVLSYRALASAFALDGDLYTRGQRVGAGLMVGYQLLLGPPSTSRVALDLSMGLLNWSRMGADRSEGDPARPYSSGPELGETGARPDFRLGVGFRL